MLLKGQSRFYYYKNCELIYSFVSVNQTELYYLVKHVMSRFIINNVIDKRQSNY